MDSLEAFKQHAIMFGDNKGTRQVNSNQQGSSQQNKNGGGNKRKNKNRNNNRQNNNTTTQTTLPSVEPSVWNQLPPAVKRLIAETKRKEKEQNNTNSNNNSTSQANNNQAQSQHQNNRTETQSNSESSQAPAQAESTSTPTIRSIMSSSRQTNAMITKSNQLNSQVTHSEDALIDSGADTTCLGPAFHIISTTDRFVNMIGYDNDMVKNNLQIGDGITLATNDS